MSDSLHLYGHSPTRFLCPWDFSRQEFWSGLPFPSPSDFPNPGIKPPFPALQVDDLPSEPPGDTLLKSESLHTKETRSEIDTCTPVFITALFIIARTWKQPRCPSADKWIRKLWYIYTVEYYSAIKKNAFESVLMRWMKLEPIIQSEVSQKDKDQYSIVMHIYGILKGGNDNPICKTEKETQMYRTDFWTLWENARVG